MPVAGVAWAQGRGIRAVEVQVDDGPWQQADAAARAVGRHLGAVALRLGGHRRARTRCAVRATDGTGAVQPEERATPFPDGATGWHTITVSVG